MFIGLMNSLLKRILRAADPDLARFSAHISPVPTLPFFALSWILCLFSHDVDSLAPVQRMFDYLLSRNPVSAVYLAVAVSLPCVPCLLERRSTLDIQSVGCGARCPGRSDRGMHVCDRGKSSTLTKL